ncbi:MAG: hypothetical protein RBS85_03410 [Methanofastidiosum sp.]|jgi:hypothetical protein|nr:hypothetical protein [Methanofastidiosum sp.]
MKKIFAVLTTLIFISSVFGVAQTIAGCATGLDCIQVGTEFEVRVPNGVPCSYYAGEDEYVKYIGITENPGGTDIIRYKTKKVGTREKLVECNGYYDAVITETCATTRNSYPMFSFMKIFDFGKKK